MLKEYGGGIEVINGNIKKTLNLPGVQVHADNTRGSGSGNEIGYKLCRYRRPWRDLSILTRIAVIRHYGGNRLSRGPFEGIEHDKEFHEVLVAGIGCRLNDIYLAAPYAIADINTYLAVAEGLYLNIAKLYAKMG